MDEQKEQIVQSASKMFVLRGVRDVSIDDVCADLRISKRTFYLHFSQKEDLVDAVMTHLQNTNTEKVRKAFKNKNSIDSLIVIIKEIRKNSDCEPHLMWKDIQKYYPKVFEKQTSEKINTVQTGIENNLRKGIEEGYYRPDIDVELISWFHTIQIKNSFDNLFENTVKFSKKRLLDFFIDSMIHLIANEKGLKYIQEFYLQKDT